jgi:hypothetical protein
VANKIIRVELKGSPSGETYQTLHAFMKAKGWSQSILYANGTKSTELPHAMYQGDSDHSCGVIAESLRDQISTTIWTKPIVMVIEWSAWAIRSA